MYIYAKKYLQHFTESQTFAFIFHHLVTLTNYLTAKKSPYESKPSAKTCKVFGKLNRTKVLTVFKSQENHDEAQRLIGRNQEPCCRDKVGTSWKILFSFPYQNFWDLLQQLEGKISKRITTLIKLPKLFCWISSLLGQSDWTWFQELFRQQRKTLCNILSLVYLLSPVKASIIYGRFYWKKHTRGVGFADSTFCLQKSKNPV